MKIGLNGVSSWLCNECGYIWPCNSHADSVPAGCALCQSLLWNAPPPEDPGSELPGA